MSVIVPCHNYARFLAECVTSVLHQGGVNVRLLVIDDASTDDTQRVGEALADIDPRVEYRRHDSNQGHIATYNEGLEWATGDYTVLLSADDMLTPGALRRAVDLFEARPNVGLVYGRPCRFSAPTPPAAAKTRVRGWTVWNGYDWIRRSCASGRNCITSPEVVVRTDLARELGGYLPQLPHTGDLEMWLRFAARADIGYIRGPDQAFYRLHPHSLRSQFNQVAVDLENRRAAFDEFFEGLGSRLPDYNQLWMQVRRNLAREALFNVCRAYDRGRVSTTPIDALIDFALATYPDATGLREFRWLRWRRRIGQRACHALQPLVVTAVARRLQAELQRQKWKRSGI